MALALLLRIKSEGSYAIGASNARLSWVNQANQRHCHFGLKPPPASRGPQRYFRPGNEEVNY